MCDIGDFCCRRFSIFGNHRSYQSKSRQPSEIPTLYVRTSSILFVRPSRCTFPTGMCRQSAATVGISSDISGAFTGTRISQKEALSIQLPRRSLREWRWPLGVWFRSTRWSVLPKSSLGPKMIALNLLTSSVFRIEGKPFSSWELLVARTENRQPFRK